MNKFAADHLGEAFRAMRSVNALATHPDFQQRGYGGALVDAITSLADAEQRSTYLFSSNPVNTEFYNSHGFFTLATLLIGGDDPSWKKPPLPITLVNTCAAFFSANLTDVSSSDGQDIRRTISTLQMLAHCGLLVPYQKHITAEVVSLYPLFISIPCICSRITRTCTCTSNTTSNNTRNTFQRFSASIHKSFCPQKSAIAVMIIQHARSSSGASDGSPTHFKFLEIPESIGDPSRVNSLISAKQALASDRR